MNYELIAALQDAPEGTRDLSDVVLINCGWERRFIDIGGAHAVVWTDPSGMRTGHGAIPPDPTRVVSDAINWVIPSDVGYVVGRGRLEAAEPLYGAMVCAIDNPDIVFGMAEHQESAALAACVAGLKARILLAQRDARGS